MLDLAPDPVGILGAIRDADGTVTDFETGYGNPAMDRMTGVSMERAYGRRLLGERPSSARTSDKRMSEWWRPDPLVVETTSRRQGPIGSVTGVFLHRALPLGDSAVVNSSPNWRPNCLDGQGRAHDLREPLMAMGMFAAQLGRRLDSATRPTSGSSSS